MSETLYHSLLRVAMLVVAFVLIFDSGLLHQATARLSDNTQVFLGNAVGVSVGVKPTELNMLTAELTQKNQEIAALQAQLQGGRPVNERSINVTTNEYTEQSPDISTYLLSLILFILLVLVVLNYGLDFARAREQMLRNEQMA